MNGLETLESYLMETEFTVNQWELVMHILKTALCSNDGLGGDAA